MHRRGMSTDGLSSQDNSHAFLSAVPGGVSHNRSRSYEFEDHMVGSIYAPREICPKCKAPRNSSVWCSVAKVHHGTDAPMPEEAAKPIEADDPSNQDALGAATASEPAAAGADTVTPKKKGWSLFKTKEEKQLQALEEEEETARKRLIKSKSNADGEKYGREIIRGAFVDGLTILSKTEKQIGVQLQLEASRRDGFEYQEDFKRRAMLKLESKERKAILKKNPNAIIQPVTVTAAAADDDAPCASPGAATDGEPDSPAGASARVDDDAATPSERPSAAGADGDASVDTTAAASPSNTDGTTS
jgi:hypothetical protein